MKPVWNSILTCTLVICAVTTTALVVHRQFFAQPINIAEPPLRRPVFVREWRSYFEKAVRFGPHNAPIQLIEFADFECPFCASFHATLKRLREQYPIQVSLAFVHYPLSGHRFAEPAARIVECAGEQGRFEEMHDRLFEQQDQFGMKLWREFAIGAGVPDLAAFESCILKTDPIPRVVEGKRLGQQLNIQGTPTLIINGWKLSVPPSAEELDRMVRAILAGRSPV